MIANKYFIIASLGEATQFDVSNGHRSPKERKENMARAKKGEVNKHFSNNIWHASAKGKTTNLPATPNSCQQRLYEQTFWVKRKRARPPVVQPVPEAPVLINSTETNPTSSSSSSSSDDYGYTESNQYGWIFTAVKDLLFSECKNSYSVNSDPNASESEDSSTSLSL